MTLSKIFFVVKFMNFWNNINDFFYNAYTSVIDVYKYINNYYNGYNSIWFFIPSHTLPISLNNINNVVEPNWIYNSKYNELNFKDYLDLKPFKFSWLSSKLCINGTDYNIDNFIETLSVYCSCTTPSLNIIFLCWCAQTKQWYKTDDNIEFHIINDMGDEETINLKEDNGSLYIKRDKLYYKKDTDNINNKSDKI